MEPNKKAAFRAEFLEKRRKLGNDEARTGSMAIMRQLSPILTKAPVVCTYITGKDREVDTWPLIFTLWEQSIPVLAPRALDNGVLEWAPVTREADVAQGRFGILEPLPDRDAATVDDAAPIIVPGIAFTRTGHRLGYGGGYFDRFLADRGNITYGVAYDCQITDDLPREPHDVPLSYVVTPSMVYDCRSGKPVH